ncbi:hypothetical protein Pfo_018488 [Paulownia fortunei]|nr:hypothetical protein Pfo_018488 [Paulownia fortunei]
MDKEYFLNGGIPPPQPLHFETIQQWNGLNCNADQSFLDPNSSIDQYSHFDSALNSMASSPAASNDTFVLRELIGKLGGSGNSTVFPAAATATVAATRYVGANSNRINDSCYNSISSSPPKLHLQNVDAMVTPPLPSFAADPGFGGRAAKFSCFGSRSFNGRTTPLRLKNGDLSRRLSTPLMGNGKLPRVLSSPSLKQAGSPVENKNLTQPQKEMSPGNGTVCGIDKKLSRLSGSVPNSNEESSVSEQIPNGETGCEASKELNSRKRKSVSRGKNKADGSISAKGFAGDEDANAKRSKPTESGKTKNGGAVTEEESKGSSNDETEERKSDQKPPEPPKDYIHVRARRGQATDSHSLAERVRREKISERMKLLQDLVPGCNKVAGKAMMLDEIINYVESLQRQVEFLSMKLASVNPGQDSNMENLPSKDMFQQSANVPQEMYPLDPSAAAFYHHQSQQSVQQLHNTDVSNGQLSQCSVDPLPLDAPFCHNLGVQLPSVDGFSESLPQFRAFGEDDLHSIVQMGVWPESCQLPCSKPNFQHES